MFTSYLSSLYSYSEKVKIKQAFWTAFGRYLSLDLNSEGEKINWINYHTGYKEVFFRMEVDQQKAYIGIELTHHDNLLRQLYFDQFQKFRFFLEESLGESWLWEQNSLDEYNRPMSKIYHQLPGVNIFDQNTWPTIISFLKPRIIGLDQFWNEVKDGFEELR